MKKIFQGTLWVLFCGIAWQATAQPATQLYLAKIKVKSSGVKVGKVKKNE